MIIYKNHHPDDFGKLHYKDGAVYSVLNKKANWITIATDKVINPRIEVWEKKKETMLNSQKFNMNQWRVLYMEKYREHLDPSLSSISVQGNFYPISSIVNDPNLFEILIQQDRISYKCKQYYNGQFVETTANISFKDIQNEVDDKIGYLERKKLVEGSITEIDQEIRLVREEENRLRSYKLSDLLTQFPEIKETEEFKNIGLSQLMIHFLQQGYIDETYYDFITVFDGTTMSLNDRDLLSRVKQNSALVAYDEKIDDVESFVQEMPRFAFGYKSALNFQVADYLEDHSVSYRQALDLFEKQFTISAVPPLDFLALYYRKGYLGSEKLWKSFIKNSTSWLRIQSYEKKEYWDTLVEAWLKYCGPNNVSGVVREWLNSNLGFCTERVDAIGTQHLKDIIQGCVFNDIYSLGPIGGQLQDDKVMDIANFILDNKMFKLTDGNIFIACEITGNPFKESLSVETLTISDILSSGNKGFVEYVFENIKSVFESYISKSLGQEQEQGLVWICNNEELEEEQKKNYLRKQALNKITDITEVENHYIAMAIRGKVLYPSWSNVLNYFKIDQEILSDDLMGFIDDNADVLKAASYPENIDSVFAGEMVYCSYLKIDTYKKLLPVLIKKVRQEDESMLDVDTGEERVRLLVENNYLSDKYETASVVLNFGAKLYAQYLSCHISSFISNYENYEIDAETLAMLLDKASSITNGQRWSLAKKVTSDHVKQNGSLADALIALMWYRKEELEWDVVEVVLRKATDTTSKMQFQKWIIKRHSEETDKIIVVIGLMPLPYREIIDENKRPLIPKDFKEYLDIIHRLGIIASYREESKGYRVYHSPK